MQCKRPSIIIIATTIALYSEETYRRGLTVVTVPTRRMGPATLNPAIKSLNYLNNVLARIEANLANADEALMLNDAGNLAECTADNLFVVKRGQIMTPPISAGALRGITRAVVFDIAAELDIKISEPELTRHDLYIADEAFLTGTAAEVIPMIKVDGRSDRGWETGGDHEAHDRAFPRVDPGNRDADFSESDRRAAQREREGAVRADCPVESFRQFVV